MEHQDFHWLTGILEGEGTFLHGPPSSPNAPAVRVVMTDRDIIERVASYFERAIVAIKPRESWHKPAYATTLRGLPAVRLMAKARPELGTVRQAKIDQVLADWGLGRTRWNYDGIACAAESCVSAAATRGLCDRHYNHWYKADRRGRPTTFKPRPLTRDDFVREEPEHTATSDCGVGWLAGLLEGEGSFERRIARGHVYPAIEVEMCSKDVVERAAALLHATTVSVRLPRSQSWSSTYVAAISGARAAEWMQRLRPLMGVRRTAAIDVALDDYDPVRLSVAPEHCVVPGCFEPHRGRGLCHKHYMSWSRDVAKGRMPRVKPLRSN